MKILVERTASPRELAAELEEPLNNVTYHVRQLVDVGCVELVSMVPAHGGRVAERFYRATQWTLFDADAWAQFSEKEKYDVTTAIVRHVSEDIGDAVLSGTFFASEDNHLSRFPMLVDREGWQEVVELLDRTLSELFDIHESVVNRRSEDSDRDEVPIKVAILHFLSPSQKRD